MISDVVVEAPAVFFSGIVRRIGMSRGDVTLTLAGDC